jgi:hypothetical protein
MQQWREVKEEREDSWIPVSAEGISHAAVLWIRIQDPVPFLPPGSGMGKKSRSGSGMNVPDHISESLETNFWIKNTLMRIQDPESFADVIFKI